MRWCFRYRKAAEAGHDGAQCNLGWCYKHGEGLTRDLKEAARYVGTPPWTLSIALRPPTRPQCLVLNIITSVL